MRIKLFFFCALFLLATACQRDENLAKQPHDVNRPRQSDQKPNGGLLRFTLGDKPMHDSYCEAQFTPRGDVFEFDNLQIYNYNLESEKYPQLLINVNFNESELGKWVDQTLPIELMAFTAAPQTKTMTSKGTITLKNITDRTIEGSFSGDLLNADTGKTFAIRGEFRAILRVNV